MHRRPAVLSLHLTINVLQPHRVPCATSHKLAGPAVFCPCQRRPGRFHHDCRCLQHRLGASAPQCVRTFMHNCVAIAVKLLATFLLGHSAVIAPLPLSLRHDDIGSQAALQWRGKPTPVRDCSPYFPASRVHACGTIVILHKRCVRQPRAAMGISHGFSVAPFPRSCYLSREPV
jgi:hypothetical protein